MYARPRVLRRSAKVPTGHRYCLGNAPSFIRRRNGAFSCFAAHGTVTHGRGAPAPLRLAVIFTLVLFLPFGAPALRGKASLPLTNNSTCYKGFTSGYAALVTVPFFVASPLATPTAMPRCSKRAGLLRPKPLWWFVGLFYASALPAFYRALLRKLLFLTTPPALATIGKGAPGCRAVAVVGCLRRGCVQRVSTFLLTRCFFGLKQVREK